VYFLVRCSFGLRQLHRVKTQLRISFEDSLPLEPYAIPQLDPIRNEADIEVLEIVGRPRGSPMETVGLA
jgi:hypothetical protein